MIHALADAAARGRSATTVRGSRPHGRGRCPAARVGDIGAARTSYERVLALRPYHADATWALAGLVEKGGDPDTAARVLEKRLEDESLTPPEKARIMTQLAGLSRAAGVEPAAERRLLEALGCVPDHIPAIIALADFYADATRWDDLEMFLREVLDGTMLASAPAALMADLHRRLASAHEKLGRDEDAYQTLVTADRMHRGHLLIKLALGENRYKARRWREAALHLSPLATHEDAVKYRARSRRASITRRSPRLRSLRPEKRRRSTRAHSRSQPSYAPALQALAEIAMEQGDHRRAADRRPVRRLPPGPRRAHAAVRALGDMAQLMLRDEERAHLLRRRSCRRPPLGSPSSRCSTSCSIAKNLAGDLRAPRLTAELMAAFGTTPADRATRYLRAARGDLGAGDRERARGAADRAVESDPYDIDAVDLASGLAIDLGEVDSAAAILTRLLTAKEDRAVPSPAASARRATLSFRLGLARAQRGDTRQAIPAYERAIQLAPESEGATQARRGLIELVRAGADPTKRDSIAPHLQAITAATGALPDLVAWAEELRRTDNADAGRAVIDLAVASGHTPDVHQSAFLSIHKPYVMRDDESYRAALDATEHALLTDPAEANLAPIAIALAEAAALLWPDQEEAFARLDASGARRIPATLHVPATAMFPRLTTALGTGPVQLYQRDSGPDVTVVGAATPVIVLGPRLAEGTAPPAEVRALLARAVELTRPEHIAFAGLSLTDAARLLASIARLFGPPPIREAANALVDDPDIQRAHDEIVKAALFVKIRTRLEQILAGLPPAELGVLTYLAACHRTADRAALLDGDPGTIASCARPRRSMSHMIPRSRSPRGSLRTKLGLGVR
jgi:tetratricopeptide (TPR) repeat protein